MMLRVALLLFFGLYLNAADKPIPGHDPKKIQILILTGYNMHDWRTMTSALREILERTGKFETRVNEEPQGCTKDTFDGYDAIILNYSNYMLRFGPAWTEATRNALLDFVKSGKGLVAYHGSLSAFAEWPEYEKMTGGAWREGSRHAPYHTFTVKIVDQNSPVAQGLGASFEQSDEISQRLRMQKGAEIVATAFDDPANCTSGTTKTCGSGKDEPVAWTFHYGRGRVFTTLLGHDLKSIGSPGFRTMFVNAVSWVAAGP